MTPTSPPQEIDFYKWVLTQGGLVVVVLILVFLYRKDILEALAKEKEKVAVLMALVGDTSRAIERQTAQSAATEKSLDRLSDAIDQRKI